MTLMKAIGAYMSRGNAPEFASEKWRYYSKLSSQQQKTFPYDVKYLSRRAVNQLLEHSKTRWLNSVGIEFLKRSEAPESVKEVLRPLYAPKGGLRFFEDEWWAEVQRRLGSADAHTWHDLCDIISSQFSRIERPLWTPQRAQAHFQDSDFVAKRASTHDILWQEFVRYETAGMPMTQRQCQDIIDLLRIDENLKVATWYRDNHATILPKELSKMWMKHLEEKGVKLNVVFREHKRIENYIAEHPVNKVVM